MSYSTFRQVPPSFNSISYLQGTDRELFLLLSVLNLTEKLVSPKNLTPQERGELHLDFFV
jgi:hypothetical protein